MKMGFQSCSLVLVLTLFVAILAHAHPDDPPSSFTDARLLVQSGSSTNIGTVEVLTPLGWYQVCSSTWGSSASRVLCRQLGYTVTTTPSYSTTHDGSMNIYYSMSCLGTEAALSDCSHTFQYTTTGCSDVILTCQPCQSNSVRLSGGLIPEQGNVEICINGGWTGVCGSSWDYKDAFVVCRQLGFPATDVISYSSMNFAGYTFTFSSTFYYDCFGNETTLTSCQSTTTSCSASRIAGVYCRGDIVSADQVCRNNDVQLAGGRDHTEGRVEICSNGVWGTVYDGGHWDYYDAAVTCRQLFGSSGHLRVNYFRSGTSRQLFGQGSGPIVLARLNCNGNEGDLFQCPLSSYNFGATHNNDIGVRCQQTRDLSDDCINGDVRLVNGSIHSEGRVEMCYNRVWGSVCDSGWDNNDASVVCRQLGYQGANATAISNSYFGEGSGPYQLNSVSCRGEEANLTECGHNTIGCLPGNDAGVRCDDTRCTHGDVRLFGGYTERDGVAEVCINGYWGDICQNHWNIIDANVFCRQLSGENTLSLPSRCCTQRRSTGNVTLANLDCSSGNPSTVVPGCSYTLVDGYSSSGCTINEESTAGCYEQNDCTVGDVRLVNGSTISDGRVEMCLNNTWGTLRTAYWSFDEAEVTCRQLGLLQDWSIPITDSSYGRGYARFETYDYQYDLIHGYNGYRGFRGCSGFEQNLINCDWRSNTIHLTVQSYSNSGSSAGVICQGIVSSSFICEENAVRLVNGTNAMEGRVEICAFGTWVTMCDNNWSFEATQAICKQLGYPSEGSFHIFQSPFGVNYSLPIAGRFYCPSGATNVGECQLTNRTSVCHYGRSIGVVCKERTYYDVSVEAPPSPFEIGSIIQLNCTVTPQPESRAPVTYQWRSLYTSSSAQNITVTIRTYFPTEIWYYCYVYDNSGRKLLGIGRGMISVRGLLHPTVPTTILQHSSETVILQVNTTDIEDRYYLRELAWYHNGQRLLPNGHMLLSEDNKTLTILNSTDEDNGVYEAMFEGLLVYPHNRYCEQIHVNLLRHYPILKPVVFQVGTKGSNFQSFDNGGVSINSTEPMLLVRPFSDGDNIILTAKGFISDFLETDQIGYFWFRNGQRISTSFLSTADHIQLLGSNYLNSSQTFTLINGTFSDAGVYEVQLIIDAYNSFYHHVQCRPYYNSFIGNSNYFGQQYVVLSQAGVNWPYIDMLSFSLEMDKPSITQEESATITCSVSIKYPPLTSISLFKDKVQLATTSEEILNLNTRDINTNAFGIYVCVMDSSGVLLQKNLLLKQIGYLKLELDVTQCSNSMDDLVEESLTSKIRDECRCNFTVNAFVNSSITCSGNSKMTFETTIEFSTDDGAETASSVINRIVNQASYSGFSLNVNGSTLNVTEACSDCDSETSFSAGAGAVAGSYIGGLLTGIIVLCFIAVIVIIVMKKRQTKSSLDPPTIVSPTLDTKPAAKPSAASPPTTTSQSTTSSQNDRYASQVRPRQTPMKPMVSTKPNKAYITKPPRVNEVEQEMYEEVDMSGDGQEAIYEETM